MTIFAAPPSASQSDRLHPSVASPGDLARMLHGLGREEDIHELTMMRRLIELERGLYRGLSLEL